mmetsp:Transcript_49768/g.122197  ORF Transcript_49768/g.122197 Transcript_49768/m.122197 type:complete len:249 (+) Transcript_49768:943-1689(+)
MKNITLPVSPSCASTCSHSVLLRSSSRCSSSALVRRSAAWNVCQPNSVGYAENSIAWRSSRVCSRRDSGFLPTGGLGVAVPLQPFAAGDAVTAAAALGVDGAVVGAAAADDVVVDAAIVAAVVVLGVVGNDVFCSSNMTSMASTLAAAPSRSSRLHSSLSTCSVCSSAAPMRGKRKNRMAVILTQNCVNACVDDSCVAAPSFCTRKLCVRNSRRRYVTAIVMSCCVHCGLPWTSSARWVGSNSFLKMM